MLYSLCRDPSFTGQKPNLFLVHCLHMEWYVLPCLLLGKFRGVFLAKLNFEKRGKKDIGSNFLKNLIIPLMKMVEELQIIQYINMENVFLVTASMPFVLYIVGLLVNTQNGRNGQQRTRGVLVV